MTIPLPNNKHVYIHMYPFLFVALLASIGGGLVSAILFLSIFNVGVKPLAGEKAPIIAREAGVRFDVAGFCNRKDATVKPPQFAPPEDSGRLIATSGQETVNWPGPPSIGAMHYWIVAAGGKLQDGTMALKATQESEQVEMTPAAVNCFVKKARQ